MIIDLRSDTVTRPTAAMREAMARAEVGDDVYGEDGTATALQEQTAALLGKEAALFVPSGTMANQLALLISTRRGDEVVCGEHAHLCWSESGAGAALAGVQFATAGRGGLFDESELDAAIKPDAYYHPRTSMVAIENTHNRAGGRVFPQDKVRALCQLAQKRGLSTHLDGARLWHAEVATGVSVAELAAPFDTVTVCFSKGLGAPVGSALAGTKAHIGEAHRLRKMLGGGMRQVGIIAEGALYALNHHRARLADDHLNAAAFARALAAHLTLAPASAVVSVDSPQTNIVNIAVPSGATDRAIAHASSHGVRLSSMGPGLLRAVFHLDVHGSEVARAAAVIADALRETCG